MTFYTAKMLEMSRRFKLERIATELGLTLRDYMSDDSAREFILENQFPNKATDRVAFIRYLYSKHIWVEPSAKLIQYWRARMDDGLGRYEVECEFRQSDRVKPPIHDAHSITTTMPEGCLIQSNGRGGVTVTNRPKVKEIRMTGNDVRGILNIPLSSRPPLAPQRHDIYLDDGTNTSP